jgi:hypothetical protein
LLLLLKLLLVPSLVASVTLASRRWGLRVGGVLTGLPMVAGPTLCFYAIEQGHPFAASASRTAMLGIAATSAFCVTYARAARTLGWPATVAAGWAALTIVATLAYQLPTLGGIGEFAIAAAALFAGGLLTPSPHVTQTPASAPRWDLPLRMIASAVVVVAFTGLAALLGARLSGLVSAFPVVTLVLAVFTHAQRGSASVATFLRAVLRGLYGFAVFCLVFSAALGAWQWTLAGSIAGALGAQIAIQAILLRFDETLR